MPDVQFELEGYKRHEQKEFEKEVGKEFLVQARGKAKVHLVFPCAREMTLICRLLRTTSSCTF